MSCRVKLVTPAAPGRDNRLFIEAVLWIARTGSPWRDLPEAFGKWLTAYIRFWRSAQKGVWERVFKALPISNMSSSTAHSSGSTSMAPAQKGDSKSGHRPLARRPDYQDHGPGGRTRESHSLPAVARPASRQHRCRALDHRSRF